VHAGDRDRPDEARRLLDLRYRLSARVADDYCAAGFTTVVQDNIFGVDVARWLRAVRARPRHLVVLRPSVDVVVARERYRAATTGKVAYRPGEVSPAELDAAVGDIPPVGLWLDTSDMTPEETVAEIVVRAADAVVDGSIGDSDDAG
jgi:hypothetical protein